jgi:hypothetical protein
VHPLENLTGGRLRVLDLGSEQDSEEQSIPFLARCLCRCRPAASALSLTAVSPRLKCLLQSLIALTATVRSSNTLFSPINSMGLTSSTVRSSITTLCFIRVFITPVISISLFVVLTLLNPAPLTYEKLQSYSPRLEYCNWICCISETS